MGKNIFDGRAFIHRPEALMVVYPSALLFGWTGIVPKGPRFTNESPDADTASGAGLSKLPHYPQPGSPC